jgi:hypothetical protein
MHETRETVLMLHNKLYRFNHNKFKELLRLGLKDSEVRERVILFYQMLGKFIIDAQEIIKFLIEEEILEEVPKPEIPP